MKGKKVEVRKLHTVDSGYKSTGIKSYVINPFLCCLDRKFLLK